MPTTALLDPPEGDRRGSLDALLETFLEEVPDAMGVIVAGANGNPIASTIPTDERIQLVAATAMARLATWAGEAVAANLRLRGMTGVTIHGRSWKVMVAPTPSHAAAVLITMADTTDPTEIEHALPGLLEAVDRTIEAEAAR